jgi:tetratricopeptide (TPR) repeat protein
MSSRAEPWTAGERRFVAGAIIVAVLIRALHWNSFSAFPWFDFLGLDAKYYDDWAQRLLREGLQAQDPYFMGPLYPHLLAAVYGVLGRSLDAVRAIQIGVSGATVLMVHVLARRYGGATIAMVSSGATALYGPLVYYSVSLLYPTITVFLAAAILLSLHDAAARRSLRLALLAGALIGVYALGRGNILLFAPFAFFWLIAAWGHPFAPRFFRWKQGLPAGVALTAGAFLLVLPATVHNFRTGDPTLLTTNAGLNLYIGNGPMASGGHETPVLLRERPDGSVQRIVADLHKDVECRTEAELVTGRSLSYTEVSAFWFDETLRVIVADPGAFASRLVMKFVHFWSTYEIPQIEHFGYLRRYSLPLRGPVLSFGLLGPLAVVGMALGLRAYRRWSLLYLFVVVYSSSIVLFFVLARYRLPIVPALLPFAAFAALELVRAVRERRWTFAGGGVAAAVVVGWLMQANLYGVDEDKAIAQIVYRHGIAEDLRENWEGAIERYEEALRLKPGYAKCHLNLGVDLARVGRRAEAIAHLEAAERFDPAYYRPPYNRGLLLEEEGRYEDAADAYRAAIEREPRYLLARTALAEMLFLENRTDEAVEQLVAVRDYQGRWEGANHPLARARADRYLGWLAQRRRATELGISDCFVGSDVFRRAEIARLRGRGEEAFGRLREYFDGGGECAEAHRAVGELLLESRRPDEARAAFERALTRATLPGAHLGLARVAAVRGDPDAAVRHLESELQIDPESSAAYLELGLIAERLLNDASRADEAFRRFREVGGDPGVLEARRRAGGAAPRRRGP